MMMTLERVLGSGPPASVDEMRMRLTDVARDMGFDHVSYVGGRTFASRTAGHAMWVRPPIIINTFPAEFLEIYHQRDFSRVDPVIAETQRRRLPFVWDAEGLSSERTAEEKDFLFLAHDFNVMRGLTVPVYGPAGDFAMFSFVAVTDQPGFQKLIGEYGHTLHLASIYSHQLASRFAEDEAGELEMKPREIEVLHWTAVGKTSAEAAEIIGISEKTVQFHLYKAMSKLGVYSKPAAAAKAVLLGLISP